MNGYETRAFFKSPAFIIFFWASFLVPYVLYRLISNKIDSYDGDEAASKKINNSARSYIVLSGVLPVIFNLILPAMALYDVPLILRNAITIQAFGSVCLLGLFFFIMFLQHFENNIAFLPIRKDAGITPLIYKSVVVSFFSSFGVLAVSLAPLIVYEKTDMDFSAYVLRYSFPLGLTGVLIAIFDLFTQMKRSVKSLKDITSVTELIACGDYSTKNTEISTRDEFGLLGNDLNFFLNNTRNLIKEINHSVEVSKSSANTLMNNIRESEERLA